MCTYADIAYTAVNILLCIIAVASLCEEKNPRGLIKAEHDDDDDDARDVIYNILY